MTRRRRPAELIAVHHVRPQGRNSLRNGAWDGNAHTGEKKRNDGITKIVEIPGRGHALTIDSGWREVAATALAFVQRFVK